ncbi:MAG: autotransporter-associated beta strand repeat-containing protein [Chthoniobacteraceae bacterium]
MKTPYLLSITGCALPLFAAASIASAATLTWDSSGANPSAPTNGGGTWSTSSANWTDGTTENSWPSGTSGSNYNAVFGGGSGSGGTVTLGGVIVCGTATFNTSGYILTGGTLSLPVSGGTSILVAANVNAEIDSYILSTGVNTTSVLAGGTLTLRGGQSLGSQGNYLTTTTSTIVLASGTYAGSGINVKGNMVVGEVGSSLSAQLNASTLQIGYGVSGTTTYVSANASSTITNTLSIGRDGKGVMDLKAGTVTVTAAAPNNVTVGVNSGANNSALLVEGGTFSINNTAAKLVINGGVTTANGAASVLVSGGVLNAPAIQFGAGSTAFAASTSGTFKVSGGTVYLGVSGSTVNAIAVNATAAPATNVILLSGGTLAATGDWTSSMAMTLSSADGGITFQAANASGVSHNIALSGTLSGNGSLTKTGNGTLSLNADNTYTGQTSVNAGTLTVNGSLASTGTVSHGATLNGSGSISGAVVASGSITGTLRFGSSLTLKGNASLTGASHTVSGALIAESGATVAPGDNAGAIGTLSIGSFSLQNGAVLSLDINGTQAGTNADQVTTTADNGLSLGGSLTLTLGSSYVATSTDTFVLILNNGTGETSTYFSGLTITSSTGSSTYSGAEGTLVDIGGQTFKLTYYGGSGSNDVELLAVPEPGTWAILLGGVGMLIGFQRMRRQSK